MRDTIQFLQWLSRKIFGGLFKRRRLVSRFFAWTVECMEDNLSDSMLGWFFLGAIAILSSVVISLIFSKFYGHSSFIPFYVGSFVVLGSFLFTVTAVLYRSFKKEQEHLMNILQKK